MSAKLDPAETECCDTAGSAIKPPPDKSAEVPGTESKKSATGRNEPVQTGYVRKHWRMVVSFLLLAIGLILDHLLHAPWFSGSGRLVWYLLAYIPVSGPVLHQAFLHLKRGSVFTEFFLMGIATIGALLIGEYPEAVAVMLFYSVGEAFQHHAVQRARANVKALLDVRPIIAHLLQGTSISTVHPKEVSVGDTIQVKPGERVPLDGYLLTERAAFDTSALTGESVPRHFQINEQVLAGMINLNRVIKIEVSSSFENSSISRILELVESASLRKAKTELFIRSFARVYTPAVVALATLLVLLPALFVTPYIFQEWLYRGLVFLVISCPCALVISIPLGYFGGIGAASRNGILVKGSNFLDALRSIETVVFDKTGTLTKGVFRVQQIQPVGRSLDELLSPLLAVERGSTHPVAKAIIKAAGEQVHSLPPVDEQTEIPGLGLRAVVNGEEVLIGNSRLMEREAIALTEKPDHTSGTLIHIAVAGEQAGYVTISDELKEDTIRGVKALRKLGVRRLIMLSGDRESVAREVGAELKLDHVYAELLPEEKAQKLEAIKREYGGIVAYAGDGINDAPVLALSDVGIAMGAMGSDVAVETADVVIQTDQPTKIATAIRIGRNTRNIVWQNITLAMGVKILFLGLGALGLATLWEAVFADVGVALLAILNAIRIQNMHFS